MSEKFVVHTEEEQQIILSALFPQGKIWDAKNIATTTMYKLLYAYGIELKVVEENLNYIFDELNFQTCSDMIVDWEKEYGMYDGCFARLVQTFIDEGTTGLPKRINLILTKIKATNCHTNQDYIDLAALLGFTITCEAECAVEPTFPFTFPFQLGGERDLYTIYIQVIGYPFPTANNSIFTATFDFYFQVDEYLTALECFFEELKPAHCIIDWVFI